MDLSTVDVFAFTTVINPVDTQLSYLCPLGVYQSGSESF